MGLILTFQAPAAEGHACTLEAKLTKGAEYRGAFTFPFSPETLAAVMLGLEPSFDPQDPREADTVAALEAAGLPAGPELLAAVGDRLGAALLASDTIQTAYETSLGASQAERQGPLPLHLRFGEGCDRAAGLPWELIRVKGRFLVKDDMVTLSRAPMGPVPVYDPACQLPMRLLLVLSEPLGASPVAPRRQSRALSYGLRQLAAEGAVVVDELHPPTYEALVEAVRGGNNYQVLHFYGHGVFDQGQGYLLFENPYGGPDPVPAADVAAALRHAGVQLVVMGACQSAQSDGDRWGSSAANLLEAGVPLVVGMQVSLLVESAPLFTKQFYLSLAAGKALPQALGEARLLLRRPLHPQLRPNWYVPTLYSRVVGAPPLFAPGDVARLKDTQTALAELAELRAEVNRLEDEAGKFGLIDSPAELVELRAAQRELQTAERRWQSKVPGGFRPTLGQLYSVPAPAAHFSGRVDDLQAVAHALEGEQPVVIWGLGGIGKTALANEVARRQRWRFPGGVLWLDCRSEPPFDGLLNQMGAFVGRPEVAELEPDQRRSAVRQALAGLERCLLVLDNLETMWEKQPEMRDFIRQRPPSCQCLLTTRDRVKEVGWPTQEILPLPAGDMVQLFSALSSVQGVKFHAEDLELIPQILDHLQGHPQALVLAVPLAALGGLSRLWDDLQAQPLKGFEGVMQASLNRLTAFQRQLFMRLAVYSIPFDRHMAGALMPERDQWEVDEGLDLLVARSLLGFDGRRYSYHSLVRQFAYQMLEKEVADRWEVHRMAAEHLQVKLSEEEGEGSPAEILEMVDQWEWAEEWEAFADRASALVDSLDRRGYWIEIETRLARALEAVRNHLQQPKLEAQLLHQMGIMAFKGTAWERAIDLYQQSLAIKERIGDQHGMAQTCNGLGLVYAAKGEWDQAINLYQQSLVTFKRMGDMPGLANTGNNLGSVYARQGEWDRAIEIYRQSLSILERVGDLHGAAQTYNNLGLVYADKRQWGRAIDMYKKSLVVKQKVGDLHGVAQTHNNLGILYAKKGEWDRAIESYQQSLAIKEQVGDLRGIAQTYNNLGLAYADKGEWEPAIKSYQQSLAVKEQVGDLSGMASTHNNLGLAYAEKREWKRAIESCLQSLATKERVGDLHGMAQTHNNLGIVYRRMGEWDRAIDVYQQSLAAKERLGDQHGMAQTYNNLGSVYVQKGELDRAFAMYQQSLAIMRQLGDRYGMAQTWANIGLFYERREDREKAAEHLAKAYRVFAQLDAKPFMQQSARDLVRILGSPEAAIAYLERLSKNA